MGKSADPYGLIRELFRKGGKDMLVSIQNMMNAIKRWQVLPLSWSKLIVQTLKKKSGSKSELNNYRGIFIVSILSLIFEKLLKFRMEPHLKANMSEFQTGGVKGKGVTDNTFYTQRYYQSCKLSKKGALDNIL